MKINAKENLMKGGLFNMLERQKEIVVEVGKYLFERGFTPVSYTHLHSLRHTFTTRMCEAGVNVKVIQDTLGHKDISTTLNIYTDVKKELRQSEFEGLDSYFKSEYNEVSNE